jgi:serine/threonine protein kinase/CheY-like chemotaxis protein
MPRVLVVDDDEAVARTVARLLGSRGYEVTIVNDAATAYATMRAQSFDAVVLDYQLGPTDANQLLGEVAGAVRELPAVLVLSGSITVGETVTAMKLGVGDVMQKPYAPEDLIARLDRLVARAAEVRTVPIPIMRGRHVSRLGSYDVQRMIAAGGMSAVYVGEHRVTGALVALKMLDPQFAANKDIIDRLLAELEVSKRIDHPGVVKVLAGERTRDGLPFLVLELIDGQSLSTILDQRGRLVPRTVTAIAAQLAAAMSAVHAAGIGHADLKPDNVLVLSATDTDGEPLIKLIDFGVAYFADRPPTKEPLVWGTPHYLAPEQWMGRPGLSSDVYALGCVAYELATGSPPFTGSLAELALAHIEHEPPPLPSSLGALAPIIAQTLAKNPSTRPSMSQLAASLTALRH